MWLEGFANALSGMNILWLLLGTGIGLVIGVLPAVGANLGVALMLPFTMGMDPAGAIIMLCAIHAACNYGDSVTSILLNIPGGPGTVATCWDGYPLAQQGRGGEALGIATFSSFIGGVAVWLMLALLVSPITVIAMSLGPPEYFALMAMALGLISVAAKGEILKGLIMVCAGLTLSAVGQDEALGTTFRFTFGLPWLDGGIPIVVATLAIFAIPPVIEMLEQGGTVAHLGVVKDSMLRGFMAPLRRPLTLLRAGGIGTFVGVLPALGVSLAGIAAYLTEKKYSKEGSQFGKGAPGGVVAAEVGKGACVVGDLIPTFTLGVPGSVTGAILMAALIMKGINPGPRFMLSGTLPYTVFAGLLLAQASFLISGLALGKWFSRIVYFPNAILAPILAVLVFLGVVTDRNYVFDIVLSLVVGVFAYALGRTGYPVVCLVLGLLLGPIMEVNFHRSLAMSFGSYAVFVTRPIAVGMIAITILFLFGPYLLSFASRYGKKPLSFLEEALEGERVSRGYKGEFMLLLIIAVTFATFLYAARGYSHLVRLFPDITSVAGLGFAIWRLSTIVIEVLALRSWGNGKTAPRVPFSLFQGTLTWQWSIGAMICYVPLVYLLGFILASSLYATGVFVMVMGYKRWKSAILIGTLVGFCTLLLAKVLQFNFPVGFLTNM